MPVQTDWSIHLTLEDVFRTQHTDIEVIRRRRPTIVDMTAEGIRQTEGLFHPVVTYQRLPVETITSDGLVLEGGFVLTGSFLAKQLAGAEEVVTAICTIGDDVEKRASDLMANGKHIEGYAADSAGIVAIGQVVDQFYSNLEASARSSGCQISHRYSPGLVSWTVDQGQPEVFAILDKINTSVQLHDSMQMYPMKSLSFVVGIGKELVRKGSECAVCGMREHCMYRSMHDTETKNGDCQRISHA